jgi:hypothetical protein
MGTKTQSETKWTSVCITSGTKADLDEYAEFNGWKLNEAVKRLLKPKLVIIRRAKLSSRSAPTT